MNLAISEDLARLDQKAIRSRSSLWVALVVAIATVVGGVGWSVHAFGSIGGLRQRLNGMKVVIANPIIETGNAEVGENRDFAFRVKNCSNRSLKLLGMRTGCTCVSIESLLPSEIPAGAWQDIVGRVYPTAAGRQDRALELYTDDPTAPVIHCAVAITGKTKFD